MSSVFTDTWLMVSSFCWLLLSPSCRKVRHSLDTAEALRGVGQHQNYPRLRLDLEDETLICVDGRPGFDSPDDGSHLLWLGRDAASTLKSVLLPLSWRIGFFKVYAASRPCRRRKAALSFLHRPNIALTRDVAKTKIIICFSENASTHPKYCTEIVYTATGWCDAMSKRL